MSLLVQRTRTSDQPEQYPTFTVVIEEKFDEVANMYKLVRRACARCTRLGLCVRADTCARARVCERARVRM
jgi:hypothetical protein